MLEEELVDLDIASFSVHFKIGSIDVILFGFALDIADGMKIGPMKRTYLGSSLGSSEIYRNDNLDGSLDGIT